MFSNTAQLAIFKETVACTEDVWFKNKKEFFIMGKDLSRINLSSLYSSRNIGIDLGTSATFDICQGERDYPGRAFRSGLSKK